MIAETLDTTALASRLRPVLLKLNRELRREIHSLGVTGVQATLLIQIKQSPGIGVRELASRERMSVPGMSKFVARLEEAGLIEATRTSGRGRPQTRVILTASGRLRFEQYIAVLEQVVVDALAGQRRSAQSRKPNSLAGYQPA